MQVIYGQVDVGAKSARSDVETNPRRQCTAQRHKINNNAPIRPSFQHDPNKTQLRGQTILNDRATHAAVLRGGVGGKLS